MRKTRIFGRILSEQSKENNVQETFMGQQQLFSQNSNDLVYCDKINYKTQLQKDAESFRRIFFRTSFDKGKAMRKTSKI